MPRAGLTRAGRVRGTVSRLDPARRVRRLWASVPAAIQITVAATTSYAIAHYLLGHPTPIVAVTVTITALGFTRDARPRRVAETVIGMLIGITLSEVLLLAIGSGVWQLVLVLCVTLLVARFVSPNPAFAAAAGTQSMLVLLLPAPDGGVFTRSLDGLVAGAVALAVTALIPRDPRRAERRDSEKFFATVESALDDVVVALRAADEPAADRALTALRGTQQTLDEWALSLDSAISIARISPFLHRHLGDLRRQSSVRGSLDLAARNLRVIARRIDFLVRDGRERPELAALFADIAEAVRMLRRDPVAARELLTPIAARLSPEHALPHAGMVEAVLVLLLRPLIVDLLQASGVAADDARSALPEV